MNELKQISNDEFNIAYCNLDNQRIMSSATKTWRKVISKDDLTRCKMIALWEALKRFKIDGGKKFSSYLYYGVQLECKKCFKQNQKLTRKSSIDHKEQPDYFFHVEIKELLDMIPPELSSIISQRFIDKMTLQEIGDANNYSHETARRKLNQAIETIQELCK